MFYGGEGKTRNKRTATVSVFLVLYKIGLKKKHKKNAGGGGGEKLENL